jgi:hypothetical protein
LFCNIALSPTKLFFLIFEDARLIVVMATMMTLMLAWASAVKVTSDLGMKLNWQLHTIQR